VLLACGALPNSGLAMAFMPGNDLVRKQAIAGPDDISENVPGAPARPALGGEALQAKMNMALLLEKQGDAAGARQMYEAVVKGLAEHLGAAEAPKAPSTLHKMARAAMMDAVERRAPKRHGTHAGDSVLLAVNGLGSFTRQDGDLNTDSAEQEQVSLDETNEEETLAASEIPTNSSKSLPAGKKGNATEAGGLLMNVTAEQLIPFYYCAVPLVIIVCLIFEYVHRRWAGIDLSEPFGIERRTDASEGMSVDHWLSGFGPLSNGFFFQGEMKGLAKMLLGALLFLSFFVLFMDWARNIWQKEFWDAIEAKHTHRFWKAMLLFGLMACVNILCNTYQSYVTSILTIRWRATLTKDLQERWLVGRAFNLQHFPASDNGMPPIENPDQRLQEDVDGFVSGGLAVFFGLIMCIGRLALFTPILFFLSPNKAFGIWYCPGWLLYVSIIYSMLGSAITHAAGRYLIPLSFIKQQVEADYRHSAIQVRDNTESIAMYGSEETEHNRLTGRFDRIQRVVWEQMKYSKQLGFFTNLYFLANDIVPFCILAGNYFRGQITLGQMMQILGALGHVSDSLNQFVGSYTTLADLRATTDRLHGFMKAVDKGKEYVKDSTMAKEVSPPGDNAALYAQQVCVRVKSDDDGSHRTLWDNAGLVVQPGERVLLLGPDGCGKSVFLRALAGCWPATGSVRIGRGDALFIPQRPFVPAGELRDAVAYPETSAQYKDEEITAVLQAVKLTALDNVPLSEVAEWQRRLSGGELQRLALAHALLRKPGLLVLDETTAAIGEDGTRELYQLLAKELPPSTAVVSVDHDAIREVGSWHNVHYTLDTGSRKWVSTAS
jgi:putative ATP-binding cassette transporter